MATIHPTALIDPLAQLGEGVVIGAYSIIKGPVRIGPGTVIHEHCNVQGQTVIGRECQIGPAAFVGLPPQHMRANPTIGQLIVGDHVIIRETATLHRSIADGEAHATRVGNHCFLMGAVHIAHDCVLGEHVIAANGVLMGGHCQIGDRVFLAGGCALHQYVRVGRLAIIAGNETSTHDVPPFAALRYGALKAYNAVGCKRAGMDRKTIHAVRSAFRCLHSHRLMPAAVEAMRKLNSDVPEVQELIDFITSSQRGVVPSHGSARLMTKQGTGVPDSDNPDFEQSGQSRMKDATHT
jgi:UDP-N-acetylglucosamine acyltransferase